MRLMAVTFPFVFVLLSACGGGDKGPTPPTATPDPTGTVTTAFSSASWIDFATGTVSFGGSALDLLVMAAGRGVADAANFTASSLVAGGLVDVGVVSGVGDITTIPTSGFIKTSAAIVGHGYVVRSSANLYYRVFVSSAFNQGIGYGANIKWAILN